MFFFGGGPKRGPWGGGNSQGVDQKTITKPLSTRRPVPEGQFSRRGGGGGNLLKK